jgi:GMP synthase-like glutamine amidotransferase
LFAMSHANTVLVLDYGSQYTQLICRRVRELGVFSVLLPGDITKARRSALSKPRAAAVAASRTWPAAAARGVGGVWRERQT